jgi:Ca-activated chloride channel family protein
MLYPLATLRDLPRSPVEMVFTLDVSGSMTGQPIEQSRAAIRWALQHMRPDDTFQVVRFAGASEKMSDRPLPATRENIARGLQYIESMQAGGGTMMLEGIRESLNFPRDESRVRFVSFLTDGYIGNEAEILREIHNSRGDSRIFSFGVGSSTNRYLLDHMAKMGAGVAAYLGLNDAADDVMSRFFDRISHPALTNVEIDFGGMQVSEMYPQRLPDLFVGRPIVVTGRFSGDGAKTIKIRGKVGNEQRETSLAVNLDDRAAQHGALAQVWARNKIAELFEQSLYETDAAALPAQIREVALEYGLMSAFTSFVAVDSSARTAGAHGTTVNVPVPVPEGVKYETTVQEAALRRK